MQKDYANKMVLIWKCRTGKWRTKLHWWKTTDLKNWKMTDGIRVVHKTVIPVHNVKNKQYRHVYVLFIMNSENSIM